MTKINFGMNYDTKALFDFDSKKLKLGYDGKEDEIIKKIEAGNVSMSTTNSLINGGTALFGINAELQFGKLRINTVISQQESQSQTVNTKEEYKQPNSLLRLINTTKTDTFSWDTISVIITIMQ